MRIGDWGPWIVELRISVFRNPQSEGGEEMNKDEMKQRKVICVPCYSPDRIVAQGTDV